MARYRSYSSTDYAARINSLSRLERIYAYQEMQRTIFNSHLIDAIVFAVSFLYFI